MHYTTFSQLVEECLYFLKHSTVYITPPNLACHVKPISNGQRIFLLTRASEESLDVHHSPLQLLEVLWNPSLQGVLYPGMAANQKALQRVMKTV